MAGSNLVKYQDLKRNGMMSPDSFSPQAEKIIQARKIGPKILGDDYLPLDAYQDFLWGYSYNSSKAAHSYFDYWYTGQDVCVYIDGLSDDTTGEDALPIIDFQFGVQQQKQPIYGFWSYTHDAVMRGTRIVNGMFRIATTTTNYMMDKVAQAANARVHNNPSNVAGLDVDEQNIEKYWWSDRNATDIMGPSLFSSHPPFSFVIVYGVQSATVYEQVNATWNDIYERDKYRNDTALMTDINERVVEADPVANSQRYNIINVELTGMQIEYSTDGQPCSEVYSFFAMDCVSPTPSSVTQNNVPSTQVGTPSNKTAPGGPVRVT